VGSILFTFLKRSFYFNLIVVIVVTPIPVFAWTNRRVITSFCIVL